MINKIIKVAPLWPEINYSIVKTNHFKNTAEGYFSTKHPTSNITFYLPRFFIWQEKAAREIFEQVIAEFSDVFSPPADMTILAKVENRPEPYFCHYNFGNVIIYREKIKKFKSLPLKQPLRAL